MQREHATNSRIFFQAQVCSYFRGSTSSPGRLAGKAARHARVGIVEKMPRIQRWRR
jgi:hypothetical protein